ncbi:MAG: hypothetical protein M5U08_15360 [Burkholderiales bacterium]|nr:hypothetical protein [Burkholderiales bacterium]
MTTSRGTLACRRVFAADGVASAVRAKLFGRRAVAYVPALEALVRVPAAAHERFAERVVLDFGGMPHGYGWIFPKRDHLNVGVYSPFGGSALRAHLERFMARCPELGRRRAIEHRGFAIPLRNAAGVFEHGPVALVGDAAGLAEAIFGEGIYFALASAALAAQAETECERGAAPLRYSALLRARLLPELRAAWWLARLLFACPEFSFGHLVRNDRASDLFAGVITGETRYRDCLRQILLAAPKWLFRERTPHELPPLGPGVPG